jgi:hypothetical protein
VLDSYLQALVAGDCVSARAMEGGRLAGQCYTFIRKYSFDHGRSFSLAPDGVEYTVNLTIQGSDVTHDGDTTWFFWLGRQASGAWLVTAGASGP